MSSVSVILPCVSFLMNCSLARGEWGRIASLLLSTSNRKIALPLPWPSLLLGTRRRGRVALRLPSHSLLLSTTKRWRRRIALLHLSARRRIAMLLLWPSLLLSTRRRRLALRIPSPSWLDTIGGGGGSHCFSLRHSCSLARRGGGLLCLSLGPPCSFAQRKRNQDCIAD